MQFFHVFEYFPAPGAEDLLHGFDNKLRRSF